MKPTLTSLTLMAALISASVASGAVAEPAQPHNAYHGPYVEFSAGKFFYFFGSPSDSGLLGNGWNANMGYFFTRKVGVEAGLFLREPYRWQSVYFPYAAVRFNAPLTDRLSFIGKLGVMMPFSSVSYQSKTKALPYTGIGLGYALSKKIELSVQYQGSVYGIVDVGLLSVGLTYHF